jgi:anthranilate synthase component 2
MRILIIDNLDSFTYNIKHYLEQFAQTVDVIGVDEIDYKLILSYDKIVISPGPGLPSEVPELANLVNNFQNAKPILGICLGHQAIAEYYGAILENKKEVDHGVAKNTIVVADDILFADIDKQFVSGRYHSWVVKKESVPEEIIVTAVDDDGNVMAFKHKTLNVRGVQFHPESILTPNGLKMIENWVKYA